MQAFSFFRWGRGRGAGVKGLLGHDWKEGGDSLEEMPLLSAPLSSPGIWELSVTFHSPGDTSQASLKAGPTPCTDLDPLPEPAPKLAPLLLIPLTLDGYVVFFSPSQGPEEDKDGQARLPRGSTAPLGPVGGGGRDLRAAPARPTGHRALSVHTRPVPWPHTSPPSCSHRKSWPVIW